MQKPAAPLKPRGGTLHVFMPWSAARNLQSRACLRNPPLRNPGRLIFSPPLLSPDAVRPWMCAWPPPLQRQLVETPYRRHSIVNFHITEKKTGNCGKRVFTTALLFGLWTGDRTQPSLERFSTRQTLPPVGTGSICRRNQFITGGNTKSKSISETEGSHGTRRSPESFSEGRVTLRRHH